MTKEQVEQHTIYKVITGSRLYGTNLPNSDEDIRGICLATQDQYMGMIDKHLGLDLFEQYEDKEEDIAIWEVRKVLMMLCNSNPNMIDLIFAPKEFWVQTSKYWENIYEQRKIFLSKKIKHSFLGYANDQFRRMERHRRWLYDDPPTKPSREEFGLPKRPVIGKDWFRAATSLPKKLLQDGLHEKIKEEKRYQDALQDYKNYEVWRKERNEERAALEAKIGYDAKHVMHLVRALRTCEEGLRTGEIHVNRRDRDADYLLKIRTCQVPYDDVMSEAKRLEEEINKLFFGNSSPLLDDVNVRKVNELCIETVRTYWKDNGTL